MKILLLGDIMGPSGREVGYNKLPNLIKEKNINFVIANGENADDTGHYAGGKHHDLLKLVPPGDNYLFFTKERNYPKWKYKSNNKQQTQKANTECDLQSIIKL